MRSRPSRLICAVFRLTRLPRAPRPPPPVRPQRLSVTQIETLIRDPYAIYARHVLGLEKLKPLLPQPDALLRGTVLHKVLERATDPEHSGALMDVAEDVLRDAVPWQAVRAFWGRALVARCAGTDGLSCRATRQDRAARRQGRLGASRFGPFTLTAKPDRIDEWPDGRLHIIDYKTGMPPSKPQQERFAKQLLLQALMAHEGAFEALGPRDVARITYLGLGGGALKAATTEIDEALLDTVRDGFFRVDPHLSGQGSGFFRTPRCRERRPEWRL